MLFSEALVFLDDAFVVEAEAVAFLLQHQPTRAVTFSIFHGSLDPRASAKTRGTLMIAAFLRSKIILVIAIGADNGPEATPRGNANLSRVPAVQGTAQRKTSRK